MRVQWGLCEEDKFRGVLAHHRDYVDQGGLMAPAFCALVVRDLSPTTVERGSEVWPRVVSRSARGAVKGFERSGVEVIPYEPVWGEVDR